MAALKKLARTEVSMQSAGVNPMSKAEEEDILGGGKGYLKIGDIIIITHEDRIFDELRGLGNPGAAALIDPTGEHAKEIEDKLNILAEQVAAKDNLKTKITS